MQNTKTLSLKEEFTENNDLVKLSAYDLLIRLNIHSFPVNPFRLFDADPSIHYNSVQNLAAYANVSVEDIIDPDSAGLIYHSSQGKDYIYINSNFQSRECLWNAAMAIGALKLNAVPRDTYYDIPTDYRPAKTFAYYFLAPDEVLKAGYLDSQEQIFHYCGLPFQESVKKATKIKSHIEDNKYLGIERVILNNFWYFINKNRKEHEA